jgi:DNA-directed RNA polymerase specialized sigma subunit
MKCYEFQEKNCSGCKVKECRYWLNIKSAGNCVIVGAKKRDWTLQDIGDAFGVTRMRICQIEKSVLKKIKRKLHA